MSFLTLSQKTPTLPKEEEKNVNLFAAPIQKKEKNMKWCNFIVSHEWIVNLTFTCNLTNCVLP